MANSDPPPPRSVRISIGPDGVEIESSYERDTLTRMVKLAKELWQETQPAPRRLAAGMGFTTALRVDDLVEEPEDEDV